MQDLLETLERSLHGQYIVKAEEQAGTTVIRCHDKEGNVIATRSLSLQQRENRDLAALVIDDLVMTISRFTI